MSKKRLTRRNVATVLGSLTTLIATDKDTGRELIARINDMLDEALDDDLFGTEGQLDPRRDRRNDE